MTHDDDLPATPVDELDAEVLAALRADERVRMLADEYAERAALGGVVEMRSWSYLLGVLARYRGMGGQVQCPLDAVGRAVRALVDENMAALPAERAAAVRAVLDV